MARANTKNVCEYGLACMSNIEHLGLMHIAPNHCAAQLMALSDLLEDN